MPTEPLRVVLDTNVLISAVVFGGSARQVVEKVINENIEGVTSLILLAEALEIINKRFTFKSEIFQLLQDQIKEEFEVINPRIEVHIARDPDDDRVLEAAVEGECDYIISGDKDLLVLKEYQGIKILTPAEFLELTKP